MFTINPIRTIVTAGQVADITQAPALIAGFKNVSTINYFDPYLLPLVTAEREERATADVTAQRADFPAAWVERLVRLRAYVIASQESQKSADDLFSVKIAQYQNGARRLDSVSPVPYQAKLSPISALNHWFIWLKFLLLQPTDAPLVLPATAGTLTMVPLPGSY